jgi:hypothetical protein
MRSRANSPCCGPHWPPGERSRTAEEGTEGNRRWRGRGLLLSQQHWEPGEYTQGETGREGSRGAATQEGAAEGDGPERTHRWDVSVVWCRRATRRC